ncbi:hypothetical protein ACFPN7_33320 [Amycolatopsis halotolerans]
MSPAAHIVDVPQVRLDHPGARIVCVEDLLEPGHGYGVGST